MDACIKIERMLFLQNVRKSVELIPNSNERNKNNYEKNTWPDEIDLQT